MEEISHEEHREISRCKLLKEKLLCQKSSHEMHQFTPIHHIRQLLVLLSILVSQKLNQTQFLQNAVHPLQALEGVARSKLL